MYGTASCLLSPPRRGHPGHSAEATTSLTQGAIALLDPMAESAPEVFLKRILPFFFSAMAEGGAAHGYWRYRSTQVDSFEGGILRGLEVAMRKMSLLSVEKFRVFVDELVDSKQEPALFLVARAYLGNPQHFADEAAQWLIDMPSALKLGYSASPRWASRELIETITPYCSEEVLERLVRVLMSVDPLWERQREARSMRGSAQQFLLSAVVESRRSMAVKQRLGELQRKLGLADISPPKPPELFFVDSPIDARQAVKMSDEHWLSAMRQYVSSGKWLQRGDALIGGAGELARVLESSAGLEPVRFAHLLLRIPQGVAPRYVDAILLGLVNAKLDPELLLRVCVYARAVGGEETGRWLSDLVGKHAELALPGGVICVILSCAVDDPEPSRDVWKDTAPRGGTYYGGEIDTFALNCNRGRAASTIGELIRESPSRLTLLLPALEKLVLDPVLAVRAATIEALKFVIEPNLNLAIRLFLEALDEQDEVLGSHHVEQFIYYAARRRYESLSSVILRMVDSPNPKVAKAGVRQLALAAYDREELDPLVDRCMAGSKAQRLAVAEVFSTNLVRGPRLERSSEVLARLFSDEDEEVRRVALRSLSMLQDVSLERYGAVVDALAGSRAAEDDIGFSLKMILRAPSRLPVSVLGVCERWVEGGSSKRSRGGRTRGIVDVVLKFYAQNRSVELRGRCLDLVDRMLLMGNYELEGELDSVFR
ncbi:hypothetical protein [Corallococcus exercitus]|uniref:hypothetical protein n=1 Tax=Corallococcus exercitus TaxID=2316736 RepID=UPI0035D4A0B1